MFLPGNDEQVRGLRENDRRDHRICSELILLDGFPISGEQCHHDTMPKTLRLLQPNQPPLEKCGRGRKCPIIGRWQIKPAKMLASMLQWRLPHGCARACELFPPSEYLLAEGFQEEVGAFCFFGSWLNHSCEFAASPVNCEQCAKE